MKFLVLAAALAFVATPALAQQGHADAGEVVSVPADDSILTTSPPSLSLTFEHSVVLTQVIVHGPEERTVPVAFTASPSAAVNYSIALPTLTPGAYEVHWRAHGDGHAMEGTLHFTVR